MLKRLRKHQLVKVLLTIYVCLIGGLLPLYLKDGYYLIGDYKFTLYKYISIICLMCMILFLSKDELPSAKQFFLPGRKDPLKIADLLIFCYAGCILISWCCSSYRGETFWGFSSWNMGLMPCLFILLGYAITRIWSEPLILQIFLRVSAVSCVAVSVLTILNRKAIDPFHVYDNMDWFDWNRRNMLSTIGNTNWLGGYLVLTICTVLYLSMNTRLPERILWQVLLFLCYAALILTDSGSSVGALAVLQILLLWLCAGSAGKLFQWSLGIAEIALFFVIAARYQIDFLFSSESSLYDIIVHPIWNKVLILFAALAILWGILGLLPGSDKRSGIRRIVIRIPILTGLILCVILLIGCQFSDNIWALTGNSSYLRLSDSWGSMRGEIWRYTLEEYAASDPKTKLIGLGPDAFGFNMMENHSNALHLQSIWEGAISANAHNIFLTILANFGLIGLLLYLTSQIFLLIAWIKREDNPFRTWGILSFLAYHFISLFMFEHVLVTPFFWICMGYAGVRRKEPDPENN